MENKWKKLLEYIARNREVESIFSSPTPQLKIEVIGLLDAIADLREIEKEANGLEFNNICDKIDCSS